MKKIIVIAALSLIGGAAFCQSPFKRLPKLYRLSSVAGAKTEITAYRFSAPTAMFLYPQKQIGTSLGFGYNRLHYVDSTGKYITDFALNISAIAAGNTVPNSNNIISLGLFASIHNQLFQFGPIYNLPSGGNPKGSFGVGFAIGVSLN